MSSPRKNSEVSCASKNCIEGGCDTECNFSQNSASPDIIFIPGSGRFTEFPVANEVLNCVSDGGNILDCIKSTNLCPKAFTPTNICVKNCSDFQAVSGINFINGNLVISDPDIVPLTIQGIIQVLPTPANDLLNIFPNLLGINGNLYIVGTNYTRITGFARLRFVTGSIVIVNNPNLMEIPTFPNLLTVGGLVEGIPPISDVGLGASLSIELPNARCGRGAIIIANNTSLPKIVGFDSVRQVKDGIFIANNPCLSHILGFIHLYRTDRLVIKSNPRLYKIVGFCNVDTFNIGLYILDNNFNGDRDLTISAFVVLESSANVVFIGNNGLKSIKLENLRIVSGQFVVRSNSQLEEIISSVQYVGDLYIENNRSLEHIRFPCLQEVNNILSISGNCLLPCIDTFDELRRIGHGLVIADNKQLYEIRNFNKLKYIGSSCANRSDVQQPDACGGCTCTTDIVFDWTSIVRMTDCIVVDDFPVDFFDNSVDSCQYVLPTDFYRLVCNPASRCGELPVDQDIPDALSYSIIIYHNQRLKAIGGFCNLRHIESNLYIIYNGVLHTINAFGQLAYALDIWIRNNFSIKFIIGFNNLLSVRDIVVYESGCIVDLDGFKSLEYAQDISIEAKTSRSVKIPRNHPIPSVLGYVLYFSYCDK